MASASLACRVPQPAGGVHAKETRGLEWRSHRRTTIENQYILVRQPLLCKNIRFHPANAASEGRIFCERGVDNSLSKAPFTKKTTETFSRPHSLFSGKKGIRTPETLLTFTRFPGGPVQPLLHLSFRDANIRLFSE